MFIHLSELLNLEGSEKISYRRNFDCEEQSLNDYLQRYARKQSESDISQTHILLDRENQKIISYYSTCNYAVQKESVASNFRFPVKQVSATLIARLAVNKPYQGQGYGSHTLVEALKQIRSISKITGIKIIIVDALNESAISFYKNFGFIQFEDNRMRLFILVSTIKKL